MSKPARIQRKRTKGWRMPKNTVYVGRPNKWCNPFKVNAGVYRGTKEIKTREDAVEAFEGFLDKDEKKMIKEELKGKNLARLRKNLI